ncbi:uncharacterized protein [Pseudochaenichthys georgianus]
MPFTWACFCGLNGSCCRREKKKKQQEEVEGEEAEQCRDRETEVW